MSHAPQSPPTEVVPGIHRLTGRVANFYLLEQREGPWGWRSVVSSPVAGEVALWEPKR